MRNRIFGLIGVLWGGFILATKMSGGAAQSGNAAYQTGQNIALGLGVLLFVAGLYYLIKGDGTVTKKRKKRKPPGGTKI